MAVTVFTSDDEKYLNDFFSLYANADQEGRVAAISFLRGMEAQRAILKGKAAEVTA